MTTLTAQPPRILSDREKAILGLMYGEAQPISRMAVAMDVGAVEMRGIILHMVQEGFCRRFERTDKPYFGLTMLGKEAAV